MTDLNDIWKAQESYNKKIRHDHPTDNWMTQYLLGMISEVDEVLREINWKRHRSTSALMNRDNVARELADITKYIISMWEYLEYAPEDMLNFVAEKNEMLDQLYLQEITKFPTRRNVLIFDLDGTVADWRTTFSYWLQRNSPELRHNIIDISPHSIHFDQDNGLAYSEYCDAKDRFESSGMYANIMPYMDAVEAVRDARFSFDAYLVCTTARPVKKYKRIWLDTWNWLKIQDIQPDVLLFESDTRILIADGLQKDNKTVLWDDDPELIVRAGNSGIKVVARRQPYNSHLSHMLNVTMVDNFLGDNIFDAWKEK